MKKKFWIWISVVLLALNIVLGYKYFKAKETKDNEIEVGQISGNPIIADDNDMTLELMSSIKQPVKYKKYKLPSKLTLSQVASRNKCSVADIKKANPALKYRRSSYKIAKGRIIKVPVKNPPVVKKAVPTPPAAKPVPAVPAPSPSTTTLGAYQKEVLNLTNSERAKHGLSALKADDAKLNNCAHAKSDDMDKNNYFAHNSPRYGSAFDMMKQFGVSYTSAGENIAMGQMTPAEVVKDWMNSSGHRANILNGKFTHIGIGYVKGSKHTYWTQQFISK